MSAAMRQVGRMSVIFNEMVLEGVASPELIQHGMTSDEERAACSNSQASMMACKLACDHEQKQVLALSTRSCYKTSSSASLLSIHNLLCPPAVRCSARSPLLVHIGVACGGSRNKSRWCGAQWPGVPGVPDPPNAELALFGGAAFERVMAEFQSAVSALGFPGGTLPC